MSMEENTTISQERIRTIQEYYKDKKKKITEKNTRDECCTNQKNKNKMTLRKKQIGKI